MIVSDTGMWSEDTPTVCTGMRGLADCEIELHGPDQDIHSGSFGGAVPNPATAAARLVAALHDDHARVAVPGFYDGITPSPTANGNSSPSSPSTKPNGCAPPSRTPPTEKAGHTTLERIWARPTAEVNGIGGGYQGPGGKTIVPASATLKLSFRLVAGQDPDHVEKAVTDWVAQQLPAYIRHTITFGAATRPCLTPSTTPPSSPSSAP